MSTSYFRNLFFFLFVAIAALGSAHAQNVTLNGAACTSGSVTFGANTIAVNTVGCGGSTLAAPSFTSAAPPNGSLGVAYSFTFSASGNPTPTYALVNPNPNPLPPGLSLNTTTGLLSGTPTAAGPFAFAVQASNSQGSALSPASSTHNVVISTVAPVITSGAPLAAAPGIAYSHTFVASQAIPTGGWSVTAGSVPTWTTLNPNTGILSGTPATGDINTTNFSVVATNSNGASAPQAVSLTVSAPTPPTVTGTPTANGTVGVPYSFSFGVTGSSPIAWSVTNGTQPTGLTLNASTGVLSGTPGAQGTFTFRVTAMNGAGTAVAPSVSTFFTITIAAAQAGGATQDVNGIVIPTPSKFAGMRPSAHSPGPNGAGSLYAYGVNTARCNNTLPAITSSWHHNIDFTNHRLQGQIDFFDMAQNESITYEFTPTMADISDGAIFIGTTGQLPLPANFVSLSTKPCDFDITKLVSGPGKDPCYATAPVDNSMYYSVSTATGPTGGICRMTPGTKYYFNLRWQYAAPGSPSNTQDSCAAIGYARCGASVQIR